MHGGELVGEAKRRAQAQLAAAMRERSNIEPLDLTRHLEGVRDWLPPRQEVPRVVLAIPSGRANWHPHFALAFIDMLSPQLEDRSKEPICRIGLERSSNLLQNRHRLVRFAQRENATHILFLDDDMIMPMDTLYRLLEHKKPIVGVNGTTRQFPVFPCAVKGGKRYSSKGKTGIEKVDHCGLAITLIDMRVFDSAPLPWFIFAYDPRNDSPGCDTYMSEDVYFYHQARKAGFDCWIDHDLSNKIKHIGELEYDMSMADDE